MLLKQLYYMYYNNKPKIFPKRVHRNVLSFQHPFEHSLGPLQNVVIINLLVHVSTKMTNTNIYPIDE
jgi:hypothetical protein